METMCCCVSLARGVSMLAMIDLAINSSLLILVLLTDLAQTLLEILACTQVDPDMIGIVTAAIVLAVFARFASSFITNVLVLGAVEAKWPKPMLPFLSINAVLVLIYVSLTIALLNLAMLGLITVSFETSLVIGTFFAYVLFELYCYVAVFFYCWHLSEQESAWEV